MTSRDLRKSKGTKAFQEENQISFSFQENENLRGLVPSRKENSMGRFCSSIEEEIEQGLFLPRSQENLNGGLSFHWKISFFHSFDFQDPVTVSIFRFET